MQRFIPEAFSDVVGEIYDCALDPDHWPVALAALCRSMGFRTATLALRELPTGRPLLSYSHGISEADLAEMLAFDKAAMEAWGGVGRNEASPLDVPLLKSRVAPDLMEENPLVDWGLRRGLIDNMAITFQRGPSTVSNVGFGRHVDEGPVGEAEVAMARLYAPHLKRSLVVSRLLEARMVDRTTFADALDCLAIAVMLIGPDLRLHHANRAGEVMLRAADPLGLRNGHITSHSGLAEALSGALGASFDDLGQRGNSIPARRADGEELVLYVFPLMKANPVSGAAAALFVAQASVPRPAPMAAISALFELTPTEARVLELVGVGRTSAEIASAMGVAASTVKTHILRVFEKTGTHRQSELVALVGSFLLPLR